MTEEPFGSPYAMCQLKILYNVTVGKYDSPDQQHNVPTLWVRFDYSRLEKNRQRRFRFKKVNHKQ